jgi:hypothetical protein
MTTLRAYEAMRERCKPKANLKEDDARELSEAFEAVEFATAAMDTLMDASYTALTHDEWVRLAQAHWGCLPNPHLSSWEIIRETLTEAVQYGSLAPDPIDEGIHVKIAAIQLLGISGLPPVAAAMVIEAFKSDMAQNKPVADWRYHP